MQDPGTTCSQGAFMLAHCNGFSHHMSTQHPTLTLSRTSSSRTSSNWATSIWPPECWQQHRQALRLAAPHPRCPRCSPGSGPPQLVEAASCSATPPRSLRSGPSTGTPWHGTSSACVCGRTQVRPRTTRAA
eukprot:8611461-Lingulodinium_polyedra.AAC.1